MTFYIVRKANILCRAFYEKKYAEEYIQMLTLGKKPTNMIY